jgi:hypothetical protein
MDRATFGAARGHDETVLSAQDEGGKGSHHRMALIRAFVFLATLAVALAPFATFAADTSPEHQQAELANGFAQFDQAQQQVSEFQAEANASAQNERMIAVLRSEALRQKQLNEVANGNALEAIAASLANAARADGDLNARNSLLIAQNQANAIVAKVDANLANAQMLAQTKGRWDELANAQAQSNQLHEIANFIQGQLAEQNMANDLIIGQQRADALHTPGIAAQTNGMAMGANELLAADTALSAGALAAMSTSIQITGKAAPVLGHAAASLANAKAQAGVT